MRTRLKSRCLFKVARTNRRCIRETRPFLRCHQAGRPAPSRWCGYSGPQAGPVLKSLGGQNSASRATATRALLRDASRAADRRRAGTLVSGAASETGEDVAEFQVHGGRAVLAALFAALSTFGNCGRRARRIHSPRLRERQARPDRSRRTRRSHSCRHRSAAPPGVAPDEGLLGDKRATGARKSSRRRR